MLWPWSHNWRVQVVERLAWLTDVSTAWGGPESRRALRTWPRRVLEYQVTARGETLADQDAAIWEGQGGPFDVPDWPQTAPLLAAVGAGASVLSVETAWRHFREGGQALVKTGQRYEVVDILEVSGAGLALESPTLEAWPQGAVVAPLIRARMVPSHTQTRIVPGAGDSPMTWEQIDRLEIPDPGPPALIYRGLEVLPFRPNRADPIPMDYTRTEDRLDPGPGIVATQDRTGRPRTAQALEFVLSGRERIDSMRRWLYRCQGRRRAFWAPTWQADLRPAGPIDVMDPVLLVRGTRNLAAYMLAVGREDIQIRTRAGYYYRRIVNVEPGPDSDSEQLWMDAPLHDSPGLIEAADVLAIAFMTPARLSTDTIEIAYETPAAARCAFGVVSLDEDEGTPDGSA